MNLNEAISRLQDKPPKWNIRQHLAIALMRAENQVSCLNCKRRRRPCAVFATCKAADKFTYFDPRDSLMTLQLSRVNTIITQIDKLTKPLNPQPST